MEIRSGLATVSGAFRCNRYSGKPGNNSAEHDGQGVTPTFSEMLDGVEAYVASEQERISDLRNG